MGSPKRVAEVSLELFDNCLVHTPRAVSPRRVGVMCKIGMSEVISGGWIGLSVTLYFIDVRVCRTGEHDDFVQEMRVVANALLVDDGRGGSFQPLGSGWTGGHSNGSEQ